MGRKAKTEGGEGQDGEQVTEEGTVRVVRDLPNPGAVINGKVFATVDLGDAGKPHISERMSSEEAAGFCKVSGYSLFAGSEDEHARAIEDALDVVRQSAEATPAGNSVANIAIGQQLAEQQESNQKMAAELYEKDLAIATQAETIAALEAKITDLRQRSGIQD